MSQHHRKEVCVEGGDREMKHDLVVLKADFIYFVNIYAINVELSWL